jgi:hypothetical protein
VGYLSASSHIEIFCQNPDSIVVESLSKLIQQ